MSQDRLNCWDWGFEGERLSPEETRWLEEA
jgi:hypothetical protein